MCDACKKWHASIIGKGLKEIMPTEIDPVALARFQRAKRIGNDVVKLRALLPTWLKAHINASAMPKPIEYDLSWHIPGVTQSQLNALRNTPFGKPYTATFEGE